MAGQQACSSPFRWKFTQHKFFDFLKFHSMCAAQTHLDYAKIFVSRINHGLGCKMWPFQHNADVFYCVNPDQTCCCVSETERPSPRPPNHVTGALPFSYCILPGLAVRELYMQQVAGTWGSRGVAQGLQHMAWFHSGFSTSRARNIWPSRCRHKPLRCAVLHATWNARANWFKCTKLSLCLFPM